MSDSRAAGRKTDEPRFTTGETERHLESQIAALTAYLEFCLQQAREIDPNADGYGHARSAQVSNAIALARMSTKLGLAMSKMKGEVSYNFNYNHNGRQSGGDSVDLRLVPLDQLDRHVPEQLAERRRRFKEFELVERPIEADPLPSPEIPRFE
jgi:hypothetical protein